MSSSEQTEEKGERGSERKEEGIWREKRCGGRGRGVGRLVRRGLAAFDGEEKTLERQWLVASLALQLPKTAGGGESPLQAEWWIVTTWGVICVCVNMEALMRWKKSPDEILYYFNSIKIRKHFNRWKGFLSLNLTSENRKLHVRERASRSMSCSLFKEIPKNPREKQMPFPYFPFIFFFFFFCLVTMFSLSFVVPPSYNCTSSNDWAH